MKVSDNIQIKLSEIRERLNILSQKDETLTEAESKELREKTQAYSDAEAKLRAALRVEGAENSNEKDTTGAGTEYRSLQARVELGRYISAAADGKKTDGVEDEFRSACLGEDAAPEAVPFAVLLPRRKEERADVATTAPSDVGAYQDEILRRVFANTAAMFLGVDFPSVFGDAVFPVISAGAVPVNVAKNTKKDSQAATIGSFSLEPRRLTASYLFAKESAARLRGMEEALRMDLSGAFSEAMDKAVLNGDGVSPNPNGFLTELAAPADPTAISAWSDVVGLVSDRVDGRYAHSLKEARILFGAASYKFASGLATAGDVRIATDYLGEFSGGYQVSALIPAPGNNNIALVLASAELGFGSAVAPVWNGGFELIRDPYSNARAGQVILTACMLWNFKVIREAPFSLGKMKLA